MIIAIILAVVVSDDTIMIGMEGMYFSLRALKARTYTWFI